MNPTLKSAIAWYCSSVQKIPLPALSSTRDILQARLDTLYQETAVYKALPAEEAALFVAVLGEIGNNCFDHNLGQWQDIPGCFFSWDFGDTITSVIADRGQGILSSLKRVRPDLQTEAHAMKLAFEIQISGRSPEHRGNGLKFVRAIVNQHQKRKLFFFSGRDCLEFGGMKVGEMGCLDEIQKKNGTGTFALLLWGKK